MTRFPSGVAAIAAAVARGDTSAVEVIQDHLTRARASQPHLNAFTQIEEEAALDAAAAVDRRVSAGAAVSPLAGVPIALKDLIDHAGRPNTAGSKYPAGIPAESAPAVTRLEAAGAVIIGRTGLHEYAFGFSSENHWFGPIHNPWDLDLSPGGSSGGSAAAVAAGVAAGALGTDTGGSVRVPAALCGVVGLKVTHGRVPLRGVFPLGPSIDTVGPIARCVTDTALLYESIAGYDPADPWSAPRPVIPPAGTTDLATTTIGVPHPWIDQAQSNEVAAGFAAAVRGLREIGATVVDLDLPDLVPSAAIEDSVYPEVAMVHDERWHNYPDTYGPDVSRRLGEVFDIDPRRYIAAQQWRARIRHTAQAALQHCDFLATPAVGASRKPIGQEYITVGGREVSYRPALSRFSALVNHTGMPALALPLDLDGVPPPSLQLIAGAWEEHRLLEIGAALERSGLSRFRTPPHALD